MLRCRLTVTPEQVNIRVSPTCPVFKRAKRATPEIGFHRVLSVPENTEEMVCTTVQAA